MDEELKVTDGEQIRRMRRARGLTQEKLALIAGVSTLTVGRIERGETTTARTLAMIERALHSED